jgi:hypothetical protein
MVWHWKKFRAGGWAMPKQISLLLLTLVVLVATFVFAERTFSPTFQQCVATHEADESGDSPKENPSIFGVTVDSYVRCSGSFVKTYESAIGAVATILIAAFTATLWVATSRQAELTREAFVADKRAFVFARGVTAFYEANSATSHFDWRAAPVWENSGDTPTRGLQIYTGSFFSNERMPENFDLRYVDPKFPAGTGMLGPKTTSPGGQAPRLGSPGLTPQDIMEIQNGRKFFYLYGWARYRDTLPGTPEHITRFCWQIFFSGNPLAFNPIVDPNGVRIFNLYMPHGNCADEECQLQGLG